MRSADIAAYCREVAQRVKHSGEWGELHETLEAAAGEIEQLREAIHRLAEQDATLSQLCKRDGSCVVIVTMDGTLTDEEREAIARAAETLRYLQADYGETQTEKDSYTLRSLLERLGGPQCTS